MLAAVFHLLFAEETAAQEGSKVVLIMLGTGLVFLCVIALGELEPLGREAAAQQPERTRPPPPGSRVLTPGDWC